MIIFSRHALLQIARRKISLSLVMETVQTSVEIIPSYRGRQLRRSVVNDKILEVVTKNEAEDIIIVTAYYLNQ